MKLSGTHQLLVYADDVNIWGGSVHTVKKNIEDLVVDSKESGLKVIAEKTKYVVMSRDQNAGRSHNIKIDNSSFDRMEKVKYMENTLTNHSSIQKEIKGRMKSGNAVIIRCRIFCLPVCYPKTQRTIQNYNFACCFVWV